MKKKIFLLLAVVSVLVCIFAISVSAATVKYDGKDYTVTTYNDVVAKTNIDVTNTSDVVIFSDGFCCPTAYVFKDQNYAGSKNVGDGQYAFDFSYINDKTEKTYTFADIRKLDIPQGVTKLAQRTFQNVTTLVEVSIPSSVTTMEFSIFEGATGLKKCIFEHGENDGLTYLGDWMFSNCTNLEALSIPDCVTKIEGRCFIRNCTNLTAMYLSKNLVSFPYTGSNSNEAPFNNNTNMYLVNESFTYDSIPEKPEIYYFPSGLSSENMTGCYFRCCSNLNKVLVFGEGVTAMPCNHYLEAAGNETVVFLGDMTNVSATSNWPWSTKKIYFANVNDKSAADVETLSYNSSTQSVFFCNAEGNTIHLMDPRKSVITKEPTCVDNAWGNTYCFCGASMGEVEIENSSNGGEHDLENAIAVNVLYDKFTSAGVKVLKCPKCGAEDITDSAPALFICKGYSAPENGDGGISIKYTVNGAAIAEYEKVTGTGLSYGMFATTKQAIDNRDIFDTNGNTVNGAISLDVTKSGFAFIALKMVGFETEESKNAEFAIGAYVVTTENGEKSYSYLQYGTPAENQKYCYITYNTITNQAEETKQ